MNLKVHNIVNIVQNHANTRTIQISSWRAILLLRCPSLGDSQRIIQRARNCGLERIIDQKKTILNCDLMELIHNHIHSFS